MASKLKVNLDTNKESYSVIKCKQNDDITLESIIYENGIAKDLSNATILIQAKKADNTYIIQSTNINKINNIITATLNKDFTRVAGETKLEIVLTESGKQNSTFSFNLEVEKSVIEGAIQSSNTVTILQDLQEKVLEAESIKEETEQLIQNGGAATTGQVAEINSQLDTKAHISYVDAKIGNIGSTKTFKGNCLFSALPIANNVNGDYWYVTDKTSNYCWNGTSWIDIGNNLNIGEKTIDPLKTTFMKIGKNLFNPSSVVNSKMVDYNYGYLSNNADHIANEYIEVLPNAEYTVNKAFNCAFYDSDKKFISGITRYTSRTFITPINCRYISISVSGYSTDSNLANATQLEIGNNETNFEKYSYFVEDKYIKINGDSIKNKSITADKCDFFVNNKNLFNKNQLTSGYLVNGTDGTFTVFQAHTMSEWIEIEPNSPLVANIACNYAFYDSDKKFISGKNSLPGGRVVISDSNAHYIRLSIDVSSEADTKINSFQLEKSYSPTTYVEYGEIINPIFIEEKDYSSIKNNFKGKKLVTLGDSITESNSWQPYVVSNFGFLSNLNLGIGGTRVAGTSSNAFWSDARVNSIPTDSDVILVMGGTNDCGQNVQIGDLSYPFDTSKFKGALATTIQKIQARCPNALIIVMSLLSGRGSVDTNGKSVNMTTPEVNTVGLTSEDYAKATQEVAHFMSVEFIDIFGRTGINQFNRATYISDTVHPNANGGKAIARVVINGLSSMQPLI